MRRVHYVLSTHWDREWYQSFQDFRYRLVQLLDRVMAGWERGELRGPFQTDGQAIILEDYLEIRPECKGKVERLVREGRFKVGPWYVLPDEFLVSGEALIRNLRLGRQIARQLGGQPSDAGFLCDMFGHNSQMPQLLAGFGIKGALVWRGTNLLENRLFRWRGADGTEIPAYRFGRIGYCTYAVSVRQMDLRGAAFTPEQIGERLDAFLAEENAQIPVGPMLAFDGCDHAEWDEAAYAVLAGRLGPYGDYEIVHSTLDDYLDELLEVQGQIEQVITGELREPGLYLGGIEAQWLIPGVASSRVNLKQANAACQTLLCSWAEPLSTFAEAVLGLPYPQGYLDAAWRWLLQNHPHDSICGCSIDAVHRDMIYRFHQCEAIANRLAAEAARHVAACITGKVGVDEVRAVIFNPLPRPFNEIAVLDLEVPNDWPGWSEMTPFETRTGVRIYDANGQEVAYQRLGQLPNRERVRVYDTAFPRGYQVHVIRVALPLAIPALGYTTLTLRAGQHGMPTRAPAGHTLLSGHRSIQNETLSVTVETNGTLSIVDRLTGSAYRGLLTFEDVADIGDGWNHGPASNDQAFLSTACSADVALVHQGANLAAFRIRTTMNLPARFDPQTNARSTETVSVVIDSVVTVKAGSRRVEVETTVYNTARDHRLRVLFPSQAVAAKTYLADSPFDVVERPIALRADNHLYREPEIECKPQQNWTAVFDDQRGLAVVAPGQMESAVQDTHERAIALTLFRSTGRTVMTNGEPDGQMQGALTFKYCIIPFDGPPDRAALFDQATLLAAGLRQCYAQPDDIQNTLESMGRGRLSPRELPAAQGFLAIEGPVVMTSLRRVGGAVEVRIFNPTNEPAAAVLRLDGWPATSPAPTSAAWVNFESQPLGPTFALNGGPIPLELGPKEIKTLSLTH